MKKIVFIIIMILLITSSSCKQDNEETNSINKDIVFDESVDLNEMIVTIENNEEYNITGEITYHANYDMDELYLMMFPNNHANEDRVSINQLLVNGETVSGSFEGEDGSAIHIVLNDEINAEDVVSISYDMDVVYPDTFRMAHYGDILYQMYFYPYVALYDGEFDIDPYSLRGETYYNVLSNYDVRISLNSDFIVSAPGEFVGSETLDGMTTHRYVLRNARDFSFSASTNYRLYEWDADGIEFAIYSIRDLTDQELIQTKEYVRKSFEVFETYVGNYYYDRFVLELGYIYGMESSGIIYCSEDISEGTLVHEIIHQWFFFMIGNDPFDESFLDESLTTYITALYFYDLYDMEGYNGYLDYRNSAKAELADRWVTYEGASLLDVPDAMGDGYAFIIYYHGPSLFREYVYQFLDNDVEEFARILSVYYDEYNGEIATIDQFLTLLQSESEVSTTKEWFYYHLNDLQDVKNTP